MISLHAHTACPVSKIFIEIFCEWLKICEIKDRHKFSAIWYTLIWFLHVNAQSRVRQLIITDYVHLTTTTFCSFKNAHGVCVLLGVCMVFIEYT